MARIGPAEVRERYGVEPRQVPDFIALRGDPSDKLPGARGVGPKGAAALLRRYGTLQQPIAEGRFVEQADELKFYKKLARWIPQHLFHHSIIRHPHGQMRPRLPANGSSAVWLTDWMNSRHPARSERDTSAGEAPVISSAP